MEKNPKENFNENLKKQFANTYKPFIMTLKGFFCFCKKLFTHINI